MRKITFLTIIISLFFQQNLLKANDFEVFGNGTESSPYTVTEAIANQGSSKWVSGYIVGYVWSGTPTKYVFSADTCTQATNLLIASSKTETNSENCIAVQLPAGTIRTGLNLVDNKSNIGKQVTLYGSLEAYFSKPGLKSVSYFSLEGGTTGGTKPADPTDVSNAILNEPFSISQGNFTIQNVTLPEGGTYVWKWDTNKYMKSSAYISGAKISESWLISPVINLSNVISPILTFDHTGKYFTANKLTEQTVLVSTNYSNGLPNTATWTSLTIPTYPTGSDWNFVNSGSISLSNFVGESNVRIAFKYSSTTAGAATWEIRNVLISGSASDLNSFKKSNKIEAFVLYNNLIFKNVAEGSEVEIFSAVGSKVLNAAVENGKVNIANLKSGMYVVRSGKLTQKIRL